ncbi:MAG TPA: hypothetical protein VK700_10400 [Steroidobacteraceae bacterium]|nr:hypothetical protein [Steroidobacteraceae bacterium]
MRALASVAVVLVASVCGPAQAGVFDGNWIGQIPPSGVHCQSIAVLTITVSGTNLSGVIHNRANVRAFTGSVDADGNASFTVPQYHYSGTIKFTADHFDANWNSGNCQRHSLGDRAPDAAQTAALLAQRKQAQATYDELTAKAAAGDRTVDFTVLRSAYPFTRQWDVYSGTTGPIMEQAKVAANGKDCATALEKLDEVLKIDYTVIVAHQVRSDCLKGDAARVESRIADGLLHSLTHAGNGRSEQTAYPVMTMHEEGDVLNDKHILLKTRDVEVRGSNGRFYDVVHGVSVWNGVRVEDVYFDVTTEVTGRSSAMAAATAVTATFP